MGYENFATRDVRLAKIIQNARKFDSPALQNQQLLMAFSNAAKINLSDDERASLEKIFLNLMKIEKDVQLSKT